jgi:dienelactone hydrolase
MSVRAADPDVGLQTAYEDDRLRIAEIRHEGSDEAAARHVVAFTGVGLGMQGIQTEEFRKTIAAGAQSRATYVIDKSRSWYNATHDAVLEHLVPLCASSGRVATLGNSMGGFGAFYFAASLPHCTRAIAFAPQFSVHPELIPPGEKRWANFRAGIGEHHRRHAFDHPSDEVDYIAFFGGDNRVELAHAYRLAKVATARTFIFIVRNCEHDVAAAIKQAGLMVSLLDLLLTRETFRPGAVMRLLRDGGLDVQRLLTTLDREKRISAKVPGDIGTDA